MTKISQIDDRGAVVAWCPIKIIDGVQMDLIALGSKVRDGDSFVILVVTVHDIYIYIYLDPVKIVI